MRYIDFVTEVCEWREEAESRSERLGPRARAVFGESNPRAEEHLDLPLRRLRQVAAGSRRRVFNDGFATTAGADHDSTRGRISAVAAGGSEESVRRDRPLPSLLEYDSHARRQPTCSPCRQPPAPRGPGPPDPRPPTISPSAAAPSANWHGLSTRSPFEALPTTPCVVEAPIPARRPCEAVKASTNQVDDERRKQVCVTSAGTARPRSGWRTTRSCAAPSQRSSSTPDSRDAEAFEAVFDPARGRS